MSRSRTLRILVDCVFLPSFLLLLPRGSTAQGSRSVASPPNSAWVGDPPTPPDRIATGPDAPRLRWDGSPTARPAAATNAADGAWTYLPFPSGPARLTHAAIYDPVRKRMVVFGGSDGLYRNDVWTQDVEGSRSWTLLAPAGTPPAPRRQPTAIYDPVRDRMIVFGGFDGSFYNDVWALSLAGTPQWTQLLPAGPTPGARAGHSAVYDPVGDRMIVFGGYDGVTPPSLRRNDVWALSLAGTPTWTPLAPAGAPPSARSSHTAVYDPAGHRMIVFGGTDPSYRNDSWSLTLDPALAWTPLTVPGGPPAPREEHKAIWDPVGNQMLIFGGYDASYYYGDLWALSFGGGAPTWSQIFRAGTPPSPRWGDTAILDGSGRLVLYGGWDYIYESDSYALTLASGGRWKALTRPPARLQGRGIYDPVRQRMIVFGGTDGEDLNDTWTLSLGGIPQWTSLATAGTPPQPRRLHSAVYDPSGDRLIVFGGLDVTFMNDVWQLSLGGTPTWSPLAPSGSPPAPRGGHAAIVDPAGARMIVFGGYDGVSPPNNRRSDVWSLSLAGPPAWTPLAPLGTPPTPRSSMTGVYDPLLQRMLVFGGTDPAYQNQVWALSLSGTPSWSLLTPGGTPPSPREEHSAILDPTRNRMVVFGGYDAVYDYSDVWALSLSGSPMWAPLNPDAYSGWPYPRWGSSAIYDALNDRMVINGGYGYGYQLDTWFLQWPSNPTAVQVSVVEADARPDVVRIAWQVSDPALSYQVQRRIADGPWQALGRTGADGAGRLTWEDRASLSVGQRSYRLGFLDGDQTRTAGEVQVEVPAGTFGLKALARAGRLAFRIDLPDGTPARLSIHDVAGRRIDARDLVGLQGETDIDLGSRTPGLYFARLTQSMRATSLRTVVTR